MGLPTSQELNAYEMLAGALADFVEAETDQGVDDWSKETMERLATAFKQINRSAAATKLRKYWALHAQNKEG